MAKKPEIKQKQRQSVTINIGDKAVKRRRGRPRKKAQAPKQAMLTSSFTTPIINYPPSQVPNIPSQFVNPKTTSIIPQIPVGPPPVKQPRGYAVFPESETAPLLGLNEKPVKLTVEQPKPQPQIPVLEPSIGRLVPPPPEVKVQDQPTQVALKPNESAFQPENLVGGIDSNLGMQFEPAVEPLATIQEQIVEPPSPTVSELSGFSGYTPTESQLSAYRKGFIPGYSKLSQTLPLPPIGQSVEQLEGSGWSEPSVEPSAEFVFDEGSSQASISVKKKKKPKFPLPEGSPPEFASDVYPPITFERPRSGKGRKQGTRFPSGYRRSSTIQREQAIPPSEATFLSS